MAEGQAASPAGREPVAVPAPGAAPSGAASVGVFDSGAGGVSVLRALVSVLPHERFEFFGDSANAPYGSRPTEEILRLTEAGVERLVEGGAKAVVLACNTATAVAAERLRAERPELPIVGVEPALKPAVLAHPGGHVVVMATPVTLALEKYHELAAHYGGGATVVAVACPALAARIERGALDAPDLVELVRSYVGRYAGWADAVVLGCTHYPFARDAIRRVLGDVELFDGAAGTARQLRRVLASHGLLAGEGLPGGVAFSSSAPDAVGLYRRLFEA